MLFNVLIPFDFSAQSIEVTKNIIRLIPSIHSKVYIVYVNEKNEVYTEKDIYNKLEVFKEGSGVQVAVLKGKTSEAVLNYADEINASVICISNTSDPKKRYDYLGSVAKELIEKSNRPVIMLKSEVNPEAVKTILLPIDLTEDNKLKISTAVFFCKLFSPTMIKLVSVVLNTDDYGLNKLALRLHRLTGFIERAGVECVGEIIRYYEEEPEQVNIGKSLIEYADQSAAEVVLVMSGEKDDHTENTLNKESQYMLSSIRNNVISITPFLRSLQYMN